MSLPVMIFAAGFGTRMGDLTKDTPKPLLKVGGIAMLDRAIAFALEAGCAPIVVNAHYLADVLTDHVSAHWGDQVLLSHEPEILDTGGGLKAARELLDGDLALTLNADTVFGTQNPLITLTDSWQANMDVLLLLTPAQTALAYARQGDYFLENSTASHRGTAAAAPYIYAGAQILRLDLLDTVDEPVFSLRALWDQLDAQGRLCATLYEDRWIDVGTPDGLALANETLRHEP